MNLLEPDDDQTTRAMIILHKLIHDNTGQGICYTLPIKGLRV